MRETNKNKIDLDNKAMKVRYLGTLLLAVLTFFGCDDNTVH